jgi:hypothetical protein
MSLLPRFSTAVRAAAGDQFAAYRRKKESGFHEGLTSAFAMCSINSSTSRLNVAAACLSTG